MEAFRELAYLLQQYASAEILVLHEHQIEDLDYQIFLALVDGKVKTRAEAAAMGGWAVDDEAFLELRMQLLHRLWNSVFFIDINYEEYELPERVAYLAWQRLAAMKTIIGAGAIKSLQDVSLPLLETAKEYDLTMIALETAMHLRQYYAIHEGKRDEYDHSCVVIEKLEKILRIEQIADEQYEAYCFDQLEGLLKPKELGEQARKLWSTLEPFRPDCETTSFLFVFHYLRMQEAVINGDWGQVDKVCSLALEDLRKRSATTREMQSAFLLNLSLAQVYGGDLALATQTLNQAIDYEEMGSSNWFRLQELKMSILFQQRAFVEAWELYRFLGRHPESSHWLSGTSILEAYKFCFLMLIEQHCVVISPREKGDLKVYQYAPEYLSPKYPLDGDRDEKYALFFMQIPRLFQRREWAKLKDMALTLASGDADYPPIQRFQALAEFFTLLPTSEDPKTSLQMAQAALKQCPLDLSAPEATRELIPFELLLELAEKV
jgi:hypothetical protein